METSTSQRLLLAAALGATLAPGMAAADALAGGHDARDDSGNDVSAANEIRVNGVRSLTSDKIPDGTLNAAQTIDVIPRVVLEQQGATRLQDALKNVPGITLNAGEGAARGDTVNLRGFPAFNDFFLDGIRDAAVYSRDSFDLESVEVLKGPSAILFGRGSTGGVINQVSKAPTLAPSWSGTLMGGTNDLARATADIDQPIGDNAAVRLNAMGEHSKVADRDDVRNRRWGLAPSIAVGIGGPDTLTVSYLHQEENNIPDVGIPFIDGRPADVPRNLDYGLKSDRRTSNVDVATGRYRHEFSDAIAVSETLRYGNYGFDNRFNAPNFGYDGSEGAPLPGTPPGQVLVGRDAPSSVGRRTTTDSQTDFTDRFDTGPVSHTLVAGLEFGREHDNVVRLLNPFGDAGETPATPLLDPDPDEPGAAQPPRTRALTTAFSRAAYVVDTVHVGPFDLTGGVRFDRFSAHYRPEALMAGVSAASLVPLDHVDNVASPRAAIVYKPTDHARIYFSYGTSFDPSAEALSLNAKTANLGPVKARSYEFGTKLDWMNGRLTTTAAVFRTQIDNAQTTDPDHPTSLVLGGNERVDGVELSATGHLTDKWEIIAGYTYLDSKTVASTTADIVDKRLANVAHNAVNLWTEYYLTDRIEIGAGGNYLSKRYADFANTATLPHYILVDAMASYALNRHVSLQVNGSNLFNKLAYQGNYYSDADENHVVPAPGRTVLFTAAVHY
ncbi:MAG: TonB-dependent receptor [Janthinobacterium lividum]